MAVKQRYYCMMNVIHSSHVFPVDGASLLHPNVWSRFPPKPPAVSGKSAERVEVGLRWLEDRAAKTVIMDAGKCMEKCEKTWAMTFRQDDLGDYEDCNVVIPSDCNDFWWFLFSSLDWWSKMWLKQKWTRAFAVEVSQTIHCVCHLCVSHEPGTCYHFFPRQKPTEVFFFTPTSCRVCRLCLDAVHQDGSHQSVLQHLGTGHGFMVSMLRGKVRNMRYTITLQGTKTSHLGKRRIIFNLPWEGIC